jgi:hypothetical protein
MRIAFIPNYDKTIFYHRVACRLEAAGHEVSWISPSHHWAKWLADAGATSILDLAQHGREWQRGVVTEADRERLAALEERAALRFNDVVLMDRILRERPADRVLAYLAVASREIERFLVERDIAIVFGEQTFAVELLVSMICRAQGRQLLAPHSVRIPGGRLGFFRGHLQAELARLGDVTAAHRTEAAAFIDDFRRTRPRPEYFHRYDKPPMPQASWPAKLLKHTRLAITDRFDETHFSPAWLVKKRAGEVLNALSHRIERPFWVPPQPAPRPYVLFPLHRQPESSIDVIGSRTSNQIELIRALARTLPATHDLYVKEHPNGLGDRTRRELNELRSIPGVKLVDPAVSSFALADTADLVITLSGTTAYEAAVLRRPAVAIADMFFGPILVANRFNPYEGNVAELLDNPQLASEDQLVAFIAKVIASSFPGIEDGPLSRPQVLDDANIESVTVGFQRVLASGPRWA